MSQNLSSAVVVIGALRVKNFNHFTKLPYRCYPLYGRFAISYYCAVGIQINRISIFKYELTTCALGVILMKGI